MTLKEKLAEITAEDGPNIPMRTVAIYCGISQSMMSKYMLGQRNLSPEKEAQVEKGLQELGNLISEIANS